MDEAKNIAAHLVNNKLAACVNIIPQLTSIYEWKGAVQEDSEYLLLIKTREDYFEAVKDAIIKLHPYELPEVISVPIKQGYDKYLNWIIEETQR